MVQAKYGGDSDFPKELAVDDAFLSDLENSEWAVQPVTIASFIMQRDYNTLADVLDMFGRLYQGFMKHPIYSSQSTTLLEKRWKEQEQPLILLAFMLHPKYVSTFQSMAMYDNRLSIMAMMNYAILYYKKFIGDNFGALPDQVNKWYHGQLPEALLYSSQEHFRFWALSALASKILSFIVQTATCERLFSSFGNFITKKRNRLALEKAHYLMQIKREVNRLDDKEEGIATTNSNSKRLIKSTEYKKINQDSDVVDVKNDVEILEEHTQSCENVDEEDDDTATLTNLVKEWS